MHRPRKDFLSRHLIDPELLPVLDLVPPVDWHIGALPEMRAQIARFAEAVIQDADDVVSQVSTARSPDGHDVPLMIHRPPGLSPSAPAILYIHGGGYVIGSAAMTKGANQRMAVDASCLVVAVDYRLAPETPHPGPVEDYYVALRWLFDHASDLAIDVTRIAVAGESAGAGLAAGLALMARDRGELGLAHQHLIYPMLDDRTGAETANPYAGEFIWSTTNNRFGWTCLLGADVGGAEVSPYAAAARAQNLSGLPSTYLAVGALDLFAEEDMEYARRLMRAGVPTEFHLFPGAFHGFELAVDASVVKRAHDLSISALRRALSPRSKPGSADR